MKFLFPILLCLSVLVSGCCSLKPVNPILLINVEIIKIDSWVNLMPGSDETFHVTGIIRLTNNENADIDSLKIKMNILQGDSVIYSIKPEFEPSVETLKPIKKGESRELTFVLDKGLRVKKELNYNLPFKSEFIFSSGSRELRFLTNEISIEKAL